MTTATFSENIIAVYCDSRKLKLLKLFLSKNNSIDNFCSELKISTYTAWVFFNCHFFFVRWVDSILRTKKKWQINKGFLSLFFYPDKKKVTIADEKKGDNLRTKKKVTICGRKKSDNLVVAFDTRSKSEIFQVQCYHILCYKSYKTVKRKSTHKKLRGWVMSDKPLFLKIGQNFTRKNLINLDFHSLLSIRKWDTPLDIVKQYPIEPN